MGKLRKMKSRERSDLPIVTHPFPPFSIYTPIVLSVQQRERFTVQKGERKMMWERETLRESDSWVGEGETHGTHTERGRDSCMGKELGFNPGTQTENKVFSII